MSVGVVRSMLGTLRYTSNQEHRLGTIPWS